MKLSKTTKHIHTKDFGWVEQVKTYLTIFGRTVTIWTVNSQMDIEVPERTIEQQIRHNMDDYRPVWFSEMPNLSNADFDQFQQSIYPTRF